MSLSEIDRLRLDAGDTDPEWQWLSDEEYQDFIENYPSKRRRSKAIDLAILSKKSNDVHERSGQEELWGNQRFENGLALIKMKWKDPAFNGAQGSVSFGGTSREEMAEIATNPDRVPDTFYKGEFAGKAEWQTNRIYMYIGRNLEPYRVCPHAIQV